MRKFYCTTEVIKAEGSQLWYVVAESLEEAKKNYNIAKVLWDEQFEPIETSLPKWEDDDDDD